MQRIITDVAYFKVCRECGAHGWIIMNGNTKLTVKNKEQGCELADRLVREGRISPEECSEICYQIRATDLPPWEISPELSKVGIIFFGRGPEPEKNDDPLGCTRN